LILPLAQWNAIPGGLPSSTIKRLLELGQQVDIGAQEVLVRQGERSDCAYLILDGDLEVQVNTAYGEVLVGRASQGDLIGEIGVFAELPRNATMRACSKVRAVRFDRAHLLAIGDTDPGLLRSVISRLGGLIGHLNNAIALYTNAVAALEQDHFDMSILDELMQPSAELVDFAQHFRRMAEQIVQRRAQRVEMASAAAIQRAMLPSTQATRLVEGRFDIFTHMLPARDIGGDLYDIIELDGDRVVITIGDVCGKGIPAALFMTFTQTVMRLVVRSGHDLRAEIGAANNLLVANNREVMHTTLFCCVLDVSSATLTYCNCGHNPPLLLRRGKSTFESLHACGPPLGISAEITYLPRSIAMAPGDLLLLYTDGVTEAGNRESAQFGTNRLEQAILEMRSESAQKVVEHVVERVTEFANGAPQSDDITCMAVIQTNRDPIPRSEA
jgi:serine phosphatase RsbU (regulator of sigma subunit)